MNPVNPLRIAAITAHLRAITLCPAANFNRQILFFKVSLAKYAKREGSAVPAKNNGSLMVSRFQAYRDWQSDKYPPGQKENGRFLKEQIPAKLLALTAE